MTALTLLSAGANPNQHSPNKGEPILNCSIGQNEPGVAKLLLQFGVDVNAVDVRGMSSLHFCARDGSVDLAKKLLAAGADVNLQDDHDWIPLFHAMILSSWEMVELFLDNGTDLSLTNDDGERAFHMLAYSDDISLVDHALARFVQEGLDIGAPITIPPGSALSKAADQNKWDLFKKLLEAGCNVNVDICEMETVLDFMVSDAICNCEAMERVIIVLKAGAHVDGINPSYSSPLDTAVSIKDHDQNGFALSYKNIVAVQHLLQANSSGKLQRLGLNDRRIDFMRLAVQKGVKDMATFIFGDACSSGPNQDLQQTIYDLSLTPEASVDGETIGLDRPPVSLYRLCRLAVRATLPKGLAFPSAVDQLPLAIHVKDFIALR